MDTAKQVLVLYYSLTGQMERVIDVVVPGLETAGHEVDKRRIEPARDWTVPMSPLRFHIDWAKTWAGMNLTQQLEPMTLDRHRYDYILLGFQPWYLAPSIPVNSFLQSPMASVFRGKKVIGLVTCRGRWERSFRIARDHIERSGGALVDGLIIQDQAPEPANLAITFYRVMEGHPPPPDHWLSRLGSFGIGDEALEVAREFGRDLASRFSEDRIIDRKGWRIVNGHLKTV